MHGRLIIVSSRRLVPENHDHSAKFCFLVSVRMLSMNALQLCGVMTGRPVVV